MRKPPTPRARPPALPAFSAAAFGATVPGSADLPVGTALSTAGTTATGVVFGLYCLFLPWTINSTFSYSFTLDFLAWQNGFPVSVSAALLDGDADAVGLVRNRFDCL